jgi:hypothetical protein
MEQLIVMSRFSLFCLLGASFSEGAMAFLIAHLIGMKVRVVPELWTGMAASTVVFCAAILAVARRSDRLMGKR